MRIMLDATCLLLRSAGVKTYMYHWSHALQRAATTDSIRLFPFFGEVGNLDHVSSSVGRIRSAMGALAVQFCNIRCNPILEAAGLAADVFHASQHLQNPPHLTTQLTATIFDMTCWLMPEVHVPDNVAATRRYGELVLRRAASCIAISEQSKIDAVEILKLPAERIHVIYPGVAEEFFTVDQAAAQAAAKRHKLDKPYFLYLGTIEPRKNVDRILDAYRSLCEPVRKEHELIITGPYGWRSEITRDRLRNLEPGIRYLGYVPEEDVPGLTAGATAFVFPSLYEGFGLPLAQAMASGAPAITSQGSSLGEVAAGTAILVDPSDTEAIAAAMQQLALSPSLRDDLRQRGRVRAAAFRWERNARQSLEFFHKLTSS